MHELAAPPIEQQDLATNVFSRVTSLDFLLVPGTTEAKRHLIFAGDDAGCVQGNSRMLTRTIVSAALLLTASTFALAQQGGQGSQSGASSNDFQNQCWDQATNQVRNQKPGSMSSGSAGSGTGSAGTSGSGSASGTTGAGGATGGATGSGSTATRPAGMLNC